ncbi:MAG: lysylphosphatidylglycerol synthase transmembrane domain-containing protein [Chloroflexota bacterium]|nr:lysylphosphatidylglycerol synthase transmembrane domain-containing protein [Chloroflexota bacterium]MDE2907780.1 lysylphosphatidylglycerol synthase transmembrane domain-containing protein [Chloroflexota bacterium]
MSARRLVFIIASVVVSAVSLYLILRAAPLSDVIERLGSADPIYLLLALLAVVMSLFTRAIRWWILLNRRITLMESFHMINVMFLGNQLPLRLGEVARGVLATRRGVPLVISGTSIVVERLIDVLTLALVIAATVSMMPTAPAELRDKGLLFGALSLCGFLTLLFFAHAPAAAQNLLNKLLSAFPPLRRLPLKMMLEHLLDGLQPLTDIRTLLSTAFWTALAWAAALTAFFVLHLALGIKVNYLLSALLGITLTSLSIAMPVSIAALGPFEVAILATGQTVGMSDHEAIALGLLLHGVNLITYAIFGTIGLLALGASPAMAFGANSETSTEDA